MTEIFAKAGPALLQVLGVGLLLGAGLPALFALGMKSMSLGRPVTADGADYAGPPTPLGRIGGVVFFGLVVLAALFGIVVIVFGKQIFGSH